MISRWQLFIPGDFLLAARQQLEELQMGGSLIPRVQISTKQVAAHTAS